MVEILHHGVKGMKWGVRKEREGSSRGQKAAEKVKDSVVSGAYAAGVRLAPREHVYGVKRALNKATEDTKYLAETTLAMHSASGVLPQNKKAMDAIEKAGIEKHKAAKYDLDEKDLHNLKKYTNAAVYSRGINGYLAIGEPEKFAEKASELKKTLNKTSVSDTTVFRSCALKFSVNGVAKKADGMSDEALQQAFDGFSKNFKGKSFKENRVFSTSTSPNFAIDTWRKVNPTAAASYNTYMVIKTKNTPGLLADGRTTKGEKIVNTRSNQEAILAPNKMTYQSLAWDPKRGMFAITVLAE